MLPDEPGLSRNTGLSRTTATNVFWPIRIKLLKEDEEKSDFPKYLINGSLHVNDKNDNNSKVLFKSCVLIGVGWPWLN